MSVRWEARSVRPFIAYGLVLGLACVTLSSSCAGLHLPAEPRGSSLSSTEQERRGPNDWLLGQKRTVEGTIPVAARGRALEAARALGTLTDAPGSWVNVGPYNIGGRVTALSVDANDAARLWLGTADGGVFVSSNAGTNWTPVFDDLTALSIGSLAVHPTVSNIVWVGTGEDNGGGFSYDGEGVYKTTDGGATWTALGLAEVRRIGRIAIDPADPDRVLVAAGGDWFSKDVHRGIYRSLDGGSSWQKVLYAGDDAGGIDLAIDPSSPNRIFAAIWQRHSAGTSWYIGGPLSGIYRSLDGGTTWSKLTAGLPSAGVGRIGLAIAPSSPQRVYACIINDQGALDGVYRSNDSGDTWAKVSNASTAALFSTYSYYFSQIRVHPTNPDAVYALDVRLLRSLDGGVSYATYANSVHVDWHDLILESGGRWLAGTDGGFFRSLNSGSTWTKATTLPITQFYDLGIDRLQPQRRFAGAQDNNTVRTTTGGLSDWTAVIGGDGLQCEVDYTNSNKVYGESQYGNIRRSTDGGSTWLNGTSGIDGNDRRNWNTPITLDPVVPATLYTGTYRVYRSTNSAVSWTPISGDLSNGHPPFGTRRGLIGRPDWPGLIGDPDAEGSRRRGADGVRAPETAHGSDRAGESHLQNLVDGTITVVSVSPVDNRVLWIGTDDGNVWVSTDAGASYAPVNPPGPAYWVTDIEPDRFDAGTAYLTVTGYRTGDRLPYVRITRDFGATWEVVGAGLPQLPVNTVLPSSEWRGRLMVGTDVGVFLSDDDGGSWSHMRSGMPYVVVLDLVEHAPSKTVYAGTHARSIYTYDLDQLGPADGDGDGVDNNTDCALSDGGAFASPAEVGQLGAVRGAAGSAELSWSSLAPQAGSGTVYDLARGTLASLATGGTSGSGSLACAAGTSFSDGEVPPAEQGFYYMVRGRNVCGAGSWGTDSQGQPRVSPACP